MRLHVTPLMAVVVAGCGYSASPSGTAGPEPTTSLLPVAPNALRPDAEDREPGLRRRARSAVDRQPALQKLPWRASHVSIDVQGVSSDGRVVLLVRTDLGPAAARRAYRAFLLAAHDSGHTYLPTFRAAG
jgi:hypothetical protein